MRVARVLLTRLVVSSVSVVTAIRRTLLMDNLLPSGVVGDNEAQL
jgi:hypothetical protein